MTTQYDFDTMDDMQNATRELAGKISNRARHVNVSANGRSILMGWASKANALANEMAGALDDHRETTARR